MPTQDLLSNLPLELIDLILLELDVRDLFLCGAVNHRWRQLTAANDRLYAAHLRKKHNLVTCGKDPLPLRAGAISDLLERYPQLSASSFFNDASTLRELALRDLHLLKSWRRGKPQKVELNSGWDGTPPEHVDAVLSVVIDPIYNLIVTGDKAGKVVFWDFQWKMAIRRICLQPDDTVAAMAIDGDYLVIGTWANTVYIARRDYEEEKPSSRRAFSVVGNFSVPSSAISICLQENVCIVGCHEGEICFFNIGASPGERSVRPEQVMDNFMLRDEARKNLSISYRKPFVFTSSKFLSQLFPQIVDEDNGRHLWEYDEDEITLRRLSIGSAVAADEETLCVFHPLNDQGDLLVAWPDQSVHSVSEIEPDLTNVPTTMALVDQAHTESVRSLASGDGYFVTASLDHTVAVFAEDGTEIVRFNHGEPIYCVAVDPCFFVAVSNTSVTIYDFAPSSLPNNKRKLSLESENDIDDSISTVSPTISSYASSTTDGPNSYTSTPPSSPEDGPSTKRRKLAIETTSSEPETSLGLDITSKAPILQH